MAETSNIDISEIINFLEHQQENIDYEEVENVVLFLGRTGTGKSTLTHFLVDPSGIECVGKEGQFVMIDKDGFISDPSETIISKTIYPMPVKYDDCLFYMDCPGFRDTRSFSMEIVSTIFTKKALKNCQGVKLVFVINYEEVKTGGDRNAFIELIENAGDFINDVEKFDNSIALFVTKVPNITKVIGNGIRELIPDSSIKQHVKDFLKTTLNTIKNPANISKGKRHVYKKAEEFITILLNDDEEDFSLSRIGIFRAPETEGPISEIEVYQQAKEELNFIIHDVLDFTDISEDDFGYTISNGSKLCIMKAIEDSVQSVSEIIRNTCEKAKQQWRDFEKNEKDFQNLSEHFVGELATWKRTYENLQSVDVTSEALDYLIEHVNKVDKECDQMKQLKNHAQLIELMEMVSNEKYRISVAKWTKPFRQAFEEVHALSDWYARLPILIIIFKYKSLDKGRSAVREFMGKLSSWINNKTLVPGETFRTALSVVATEFSVLQLGYDINTVKLKLLNKLCVAAKLDKLEPQRGFLAFLKKGVLVTANGILNLLDGKAPYDGDPFGEVRRMCNMEG